MATAQNRPAGRLEVYCFVNERVLRVVLEGVLSGVNPASFPEARALGPFLDHRFFCLLRRWRCSSGQKEGRSWSVGRIEGDSREIRMGKWESLAEGRVWDVEWRRRGWARRGSGCRPGVGAHRGG